MKNFKWEGIVRVLQCSANYLSCYKYYQIRSFVKIFSTVYSKTRQVLTWFLTQPLNREFCISYLRWKTTTTDTCQWGTSSKLGEGSKLNIMYWPINFYRICCKFLKIIRFWKWHDLKTTMNHQKSFEVHLNFNITQKKCEDGEINIYQRSNLKNPKKIFELCRDFFKPFEERLYKTNQKFLLF